MAEWIHNGYECSECYEWIEQGDHGYLFRNYAIVPSECPRCHSEMTAVVYEGGSEDGN